MKKGRISHVIVSIYQKSYHDKEKNIWCTVEGFRKEQIHQAKRNSGFLSADFK